MSTSEKPQSLWTIVDRALGSSPDLTGDAYSEIEAWVLDALVRMAFKPTSAQRHGATGNQSPLDPAFKAKLDAEGDERQLKRLRERARAFIEGRDV